jgi:hypothetical protein
MIFLGVSVFAGWATFSVSAPWIVNPMTFFYRHLRLSVVPFGCLFLLYTYLIVKMRRCLTYHQPKISQLTYYDRLLNMVISCFFGVGVIWTALGIETALMEALNGVNEGQEAVASGGAWMLLERLVNGGLLLALSTTVFGGICGYFLKLMKIFLLGRAWDRLMLDENE